MSMSPYRHIVAAIDLTDDSRTVAARACELAQVAGGTVQLLHVVEFIPLAPMGDSLVPELQIDQEIVDQARQRIATLAMQLGLPPAVGTIETGNAKSEILRYARAHDIDLIVIGCRERHGLSLLLHRTEAAVLHGAPCDVLAVRVREP